MQRILLTYQWLGDFNYAKAKIFDGFESLIIYENYGKCNTFELDVPFSFENNSIFKPENIFKFDGVYYYVDDVSGTSDKLKVCGKSLAGKYDSRIIDRTYIASKSPALIAWDHINQEIINPGNYSDINGSYNGADRKIDYLTLGNQYLHSAYANSEDGTEDFTTVYPNLNLLDGTSSDLKTVSANGWGTQDSLTTNTIDFKKGESYTYSAWIQDCDIDTRAVIYLFGSSSGFEAHLGNTITASSSGLSTVTFNISDDIASYKTSIGFMESQASYHNLSYSRLKLEPGSTATPYMPSSSEVTTADWPSYIGQYLDYTHANSKNPKDYTWSPFSGTVPSPIENPKTTTDLGLAAIDYQNSYGEVQKQVETLCETYNFGFKEVGAKGVVSNQIQFFKGRDVSKWVVFSDDSDGYENLNEVEFEHSTFDKKTVAYAFGEGEGSDRKKIVLNPTIKGLSRRELYVDARDLQSSDGTTTIPSATYNNMLKDRANQSLADKKEVITLNGDFVLTSKLVQFGRDFFVGDTVRLTSKRYGAAKTAVISQAKKTYNDKGEYLELIYDKETPTIFDILGRNK